MTYRNQAHGAQVHNFAIYEQTIGIDATKVVASITVPSNEIIHIFALSH